MHGGVPCRQAPRLADLAVAELKTEVCVAIGIALAIMVDINVQSACNGDL